MKKRTNVTSKNPIIIDLINLFSRLVDDKTKSSRLCKSTLDKV